MRLRFGTCLKSRFVIAVWSCLALIAGGLEGCCGSPGIPLEGPLDLAMARDAEFMDPTSDAMHDLGKTGALEIAFQVLAPVPTPVHRPTVMLQADFNHDNRLDFVVAADRPGGLTAIHLATANSGLSSGSIVGTVSSPHALTTADFNADHEPDLIIGDEANADYQVLLGVGDGTFRKSPLVSVPFAPSGLAVLDFDLNGTLDLAVTNFRPGVGHTTILSGDGHGTFQLTGDDYLTGVSPIAIFATPFMRDGAVGLVVADQTSPPLYGLVPNGSGMFTTSKTTGTGGANALAIGDLDGDGFTDAITVAPGLGSVVVFHGTGDGGFNRPNTYFVGSLLSALVIADFNADGVPDMAALDSQSGVNIVLGIGGGYFGGATPIALSGSFQTMLTGDYNGDFKPDLMVADWSGDNLIEVLNESH